MTLELVRGTMGEVDERGYMGSLIPPSQTLSFDEYQKLSKETAVFPEVSSRLTDVTLDYLIASGQLAGIIKKLYRDSDGKITPEIKIKLTKQIDKAFDSLNELEFLISNEDEEPGEFPQPAAAYPLLGLFDEVAELTEKVAKNDVEGAEKELGDCGWYMAQIPTALKLLLGKAMQLNLIKLFDRKDRGVLKSSGDNR